MKRRYELNDILVNTEVKRVDCVVLIAFKKCPLIFNFFLKEHDVPWCGLKMFFN